MDTSQTFDTMHWSAVHDSFHNFALTSSAPVTAPNPPFSPTHHPFALPFPDLPSSPSCFPLIQLRLPRPLSRSRSSRHPRRVYGFATLRRDDTCDADLCEVAEGNDTPEVDVFLIAIQSLPAIEILRSSLALACTGQWMLSDVVWLGLSKD